ncbi:MAG TPA: hypothetical protein ENI97_10540 [Gammaproteobacteria bacterium]|nr:hypothetical protein [Gammaproteobacteria bacterium]
MSPAFVKNLFRGMSVLQLGMIALVLGACAPQPRFDASAKPEWVDGSSRKFTSDRYFIGKGHAAALDVAAKNARDALLETLPGITEALSPPVMENLQQQIDVVDAWQDKETRQHYALVVLEHTATADMLHKQLTELDSKTRQLIKIATQDVDPLVKIRATHDALATHQTRADLLLALQSLGQEARADDGVWSITEMQVHLKSLLEGIAIAPRTNGDALLGSAVVRALDDAGYLSKRAQPDYVLNTSLQRSGMKWEQGRFVEKGTLRVELLNQQQQVVGRAQWPITVQAQERVMLEKQLMGEVANTLREQLAGTVLGVPTQ